MRPESAGVGEPLQKRRGKAPTPQDRGRSLPSPRHTKWIHRNHVRDPLPPAAQTLRVNSTRKEARQSTLFTDHDVETTRTQLWQKLWTEGAVGRDLGSGVKLRAAAVRTLRNRHWPTPWKPRAYHQPATVLDSRVCGASAVPLTQTEGLPAPLSWPVSLKRTDKTYNRADAAGVHYSPRGIRSSMSASTPRGTKK
jgi:hypothetical protein